MKTSFLITVVSLLASFTNAQTTSSKTTSSTNISVSISSTDDSYSYSARFEKPNTYEAKNAVINLLGKPTEETERGTIWKGKGYSVILRQGKIEMEMETAEVTKSFQMKFEDMCDQVSKSIGSPKTPIPPKMR